MASNYTEHYQLPLWEPEDNFLREEFNDTNQKIDTALTGLANRLYVGTRTCDGTYGADNAITVDFPFQPRAVYIGLLDRTSYAGGWFAYGTERVYVKYSEGTGSDGYLNLSWNGNRLTYYSASNASVQFNYSGQTIYIAVG